ncbi:MAG: hypothetical protein A2Y12_19840 [Planctomycetes bacterium GWF2_42_9]|nr:MAG: hypothetical protein A2Y12_19840 [Planctomycetes bacterium GWF2_42_9]
MKKFFFLFVLVSLIFITSGCLNKACLCLTPRINEAPSLPRGRGGHAAGIVDGKVFVVGGSDWSSDHTKKFWLGDSIYFSGNRWQNGPTLPHPLAYTMFAQDNTGIYLAGGTDGISNLKSVYHLADLHGSWKSCAQLPMGMASGSAALFNGKLYAACGWTDHGITNEMWSLNVKHPDTKWNKCAPLPGPKRAFPALVACNDRLYLFGGTCTDPNSGSQIILQDAFRYDPSNNAWTRLKDLPCKGYGWAGSSINKNCIILVGKADGQIHKDIYLIDVRDMHTKKIGETVIQTTTAPLVRLAPKEFWLIGGEPDSNKNRTSQITSIKFK